MSRWIDEEVATVGTRQPDDVPTPYRVGYFGTVGRRRIACRGFASPFTVLPDRLRQPFSNRQIVLSRAPVKVNQEAVRHRLGSRMTGGVSIFDRAKR